MENPGQFRVEINTRDSHDCGPYTRTGLLTLAVIADSNTGSPLCTTLAQRLGQRMIAE